MAEQVDSGDYTWDAGSGDRAMEGDGGAMTVREKALGLLTSRKVWLAAIALAVLLAGFVQGSVDMDTLAEGIVALVVAVVVAIGIEDHGLRSSGR